MLEKHVCYICGAEAQFQLKNKKWCCQPFAQQCPVSKKLRQQSTAKHWAKLKDLGYRTQVRKELKEEDQEKLGLKNRVSKEEIIQKRLQLKEAPELCTCAFCGQPAQFLLKNGKYCCSNTASKCKAVREKNSKGCKKYYDSLESQGRKRSHFNYEELPESTKEKMKIIKKGDSIATNSILAKCQETRKKNHELEQWVSWNKGVPETEEHKEAIRQGTIKYLKESGQIDLHAPKRISLKSKKFIEELNKEKGWNLQHGYNQGEFEVGGYFLDGYDKEKNIAFEYDEPYHYINWSKNILKEKDLKRQEFIIKKLNCAFYRYNERKNYLYKVN